MLRNILVYIGGSLNILWGISHLIPTGNIVRDFGNISMDNRHIIQMEWINEGLTLIFIGLLVILVTALTKVMTKTTKAVYLLSFLMLITMAVLSLFTGFKVDFLPFKLCPLIFTISGILVVQRSFGHEDGSNS